MSTSQHRRQSGDEPSVIVRHVGGRRVVSRSNPEISYAYGAPAAPGTNIRKRRTTSTTPGPEEEAADASTSSASVEQQQDVQPDPRARYQALKRRKLQEAQEQEQREQQQEQRQEEENEQQRPQPKSSKVPSKGSRAGSANDVRKSPRKARETALSEQRPLDTIISQPRNPLSSHGGSDDVSNSAAAARQRLMSPGRSRSLLHGQLNSFYMDRDASTEDDVAQGSGSRDEKGVPSSILLGAQRQGHNMLSGIALPELDSIHSSDIQDSGSRDYAELQREADLLAEAEGSSVSGSVRNAPIARRNANGSRNEFKGKGAADRTVDRSTTKAALNGITEESDAELSGTEGRKHSQRTAAVDRKKMSGSAQSATVSVSNAAAAKPLQLPRPISRSSRSSRKLPWLLLALGGIAVAMLYAMQRRNYDMDWSGFSPILRNATLSDQALRVRIHTLEKRLAQAEKQALHFHRQVGETRSLADRVADSVKDVPSELASLRSKSDDQRKLDAGLLQELRKIFVVKGEKEDRSQSWDAFLRQNEDALRKLTTSIMAEEARKDNTIVSRSTVVALLQTELDKLKSKMETRFNENVQGVQNDILAKVRTQQEMFERSGSWKKQSQKQHLGNVQPGAERDSIAGLIEEALEVFAADRIGERDFALFSAGGRIIPSLTSPTYGLRTKESSWLGWLGISTAASSIERNGVEGQPPVIALVPDNTPGMCWAFAGSEGHLGISLARRVIVSNVTLEHTPASISHEAGISAPRDVTVWGIVERPIDVKRLTAYRREQLRGYAASAADNEDDDHYSNDSTPTPAPPSDRHLLLASFSYEAFASRSIQTFSVSREASQLQAPVAIVQVRIHSNHGKPDYTCLYRVRVHGREWTLDDEVAAATGSDTANNVET